MGESLLSLFIDLTVRDRDVERKFKKWEARGEALEKQLSQVGDGMETSARKTETAGARIVKTLTGVEKKAKDVSRQNVTLNTELKGAGQVTSSLEAIKNRQKDLDRSRITLSTSLKGARNAIGELTQLEGVSTRIDGDKVTLTADVDGTQEGRAALASLQQAASRLDGDDIRMKAEVVGAPAAVAELAELNREADRVDGRNVRLNVDRSSVGALQALGSALDSVATRMRSLQTVGAAAVIPGLVAAVGAIPAIVTPAVAALGALATGMGAGLAGAATIGGTAIGGMATGLFGYVAAATAAVAGALDIRENLEAQRLATEGASIAVDEARKALSEAEPGTLEYRDAQLALAEATKEQADAQRELTRLQILNTPAAQKFNATIQAAILPLTRVQAELGNRVLPSFSRLIDLAVNKLPQLTPPLYRMVSGITGVGESFVTATLNSRRFYSILDFISRSGIQGARIFADLGTILINVLQPVIPVADRLVGHLVRLTAQAARWTGTTEGMRVMGGVVAKTEQRFYQLLAVIGNLTAGFYGLFAAFEQAGLVDQVWGGFVRLTREFREFTRAGTEGRASIVSFSNAAQPILSALWGLIEEVVVQWFRVANAIMTMRNEAGKLVLPQALKDIQSALPIIGDLLIAAFRNFGPYIGPIIQGLAEFAKYAVAMNPVLINLTRGLAWLLTQFRQLSPGMKTAIASAASLRIAFAIAVPVIAALFSPLTRILGVIGMGGGLAGIAPRAAMAMRGLGVAFTFMTGPIGLTIAIIAALAAGLVYAYRNSETFRNIVNGAFNAVRTVVVGAVNAIRNIVRQVWGFISPYVRAQMAVIRAAVMAGWNIIRATTVRIWNGLKTYFIGFWRVIKGFFTANPRLIGQGLQMMWRGMVTVAKAIWAGLRAFFRLWWNTVRALFGNAVRLVGRILQAAWRGIGAVARAVWNGIRQFFVGWARQIANLWRTFWAGVRRLWESATRAIRQWVQGWLRNIVSAIGNFIRDVKQRWNNFWRDVRLLWENTTRAIRLWVQGWLRNIVEAIGGFIRDVKQRWTDFWARVQETWETKTREIREWVQGWVENVKERFADLREGVWDAMKSVGRALWEPVKDAWSKAKEWINKIIDLINPILDKVGIDKIGHVGEGSGVVAPRRSPGVGRPVAMARGGMIRSGGVAHSPTYMPPTLYGEAGDEAYARLDKKTPESQEAARAIMRSPNAPPEYLPRKHVGMGVGGMLEKMAAGGISGVREMTEAVKKKWPSVRLVDRHAEYMPADQAARSMDFFVAPSGTVAQGPARTMGDEIAAFLAPPSAAGVVWMDRMNFGSGWGPIQGAVGFGNENSLMHRDHVHGMAHEAGFKGGLGVGDSGGFNPLRGIFEAAWNRIIQPVVDRFLNPMKNSDNVMTQMAGGLVGKVPEGIKEWVLSKLGSSSSDPGKFSGGGDPAKNRALGEKMNADRGWRIHWGALDSLWQKESGWNHLADNPTSDAYGIPQAMTTAHQMPAGYGPPGGDPAVQIAWGLDYIAGRYGTPSEAWNHSQSVGWYEKGGRIPGREGDPKNIMAHAGEIVLPQGVSDNFVKFTEWMKELVEKIRRLGGGARVSDTGSTNVTSSSGTTTEQNRSETNITSSGGGTQYVVTHNGKVVASSGDAQAGGGARVGNISAGVINRGAIHRPGRLGQSVNINLGAGIERRLESLERAVRDNKEVELGNSTREDMKQSQVEVTQRTMQTRKGRDIIHEQTQSKNIVQSSRGTISRSGN